MKFAFAQKLLTFLMAIVASIPLLISEEIGFVFIIGFIFLALAGWFLEPPLTEFVKYRRFITAIIVAVFLIQLFRITGDAPPAKLAMEFAILLMGLKLCSRARYFDYQQIAILSFLLLIGATVTTFNISYGICFVIFVLLCPPVLSMSHLRNEMENHFKNDTKHANKQMLERLFASKRVVSTRDILATGFLALPVLLITVVLFIGFPRFGFGIFDMKSNAQSLAGFANEIKIGDIDETKLKGSIFVRLVPLNEPPNKKQNHPVYLSVKLRGAVFDTYHNSTWTNKKIANFKQMSHRGNNYKIERGFVADNVAGFTVFQESLNPAYLFVPNGTGQIETNSIAENGKLKNQNLKINEMGVIKYENNAGVGIKFVAKITGAQIPGKTTQPGKAYLSLPKNFRREKQLAHKMVKTGAAHQKTSTAHQKADLIVKALKKHYKYSKTPLKTPLKTKKKDNTSSVLPLSPLSNFLFHSKKGTCEHFATAATLLLRAQGIPSRLVTGFSGAHWNSIGNFYTVRSKFAHAWTEAYIDEKWITFDATPPDLESGDIFKGSSTIAMVIDAIKMRWHKHVVGYDVSSQVEIAKEVRKLWIFSHKSGEFFNISFLKIGIIIVLAFLVIVFIIVKVLKKWNLFSFVSLKNKKKYLQKRTLGSSQRGSSRLKATALFIILENRLTKLGFVRFVNQTPKEYLKEIKASNKHAGSIVSRIIKRYHEVRFGEDSFASNEIAQMKREISQLKL